MVVVVVVVVVVVLSNGLKAFIYSHNCCFPSNTGSLMKYTSASFSICTDLFGP